MSATTFYHFITELLGIKDNHVELWSVDYANEFSVELRTKVKRQTCKHCKNRTKRVHGYRWQTIKTLAPSHILVRIILKKRRYL